MAVPAREFTTFQDFWAVISGPVQVRNHPTYHPCCKVWTSRQQSILRKSHSSSITWGSVLNSMGCPQTEPAVLLKAHMIENGWGPPIKLNAKCALFQQQLPAQTPPSTVQPASLMPLFSGAFQVHRTAMATASPNSTPATPHHSPSSPHVKSVQQNINPVYRLDSESANNSAR